MVDLNEQLETSMDDLGEGLLRQFSEATASSDTIPRKSLLDIFGEDKEKWSKTHEIFLSGPCGRLPIELMTMVKGYIPISDLRTHVCFYHTCRAVATLYGPPSEQEMFWYRSCRSTGITVFNQDETYKALAFRCISQDGFCRHPSCGGSLLKRNVAQLDRWKDVWGPEDLNEYKTYHDQSSLFGTWDSEVHEERFLETTSNIIFSLIDFSSEGPGQTRLYKECLEWDGILRDPSTNPSSAVPSSLISNHPLVLHSMTTFPPLHTMWIGFGEEYNLSFCHDITLMINDEHEGVTVKHVLSEILNRLDDNLYVGQLRTMLQWSFKAPVRSLEEKGFSTSAIMEGCDTLRELLNTSGAAWAGFQLQGADAQIPYFMQTFTFPPLCHTNVARCR